MEVCGKDMSCLPRFFEEMNCSATFLPIVADVLQNAVQSNLLSFHRGTTRWPTNNVRDYVSVSPGTPGRSDRAACSGRNANSLFCSAGNPTQTVSSATKLQDE